MFTVRTKRWGFSRLFPGKVKSSLEWNFFNSLEWNFGSSLSLSLSLRRLVLFSSCTLESHTLKVLQHLPFAFFTVRGRWRRQNRRVVAEPRMYVPFNFLAGFSHGNEYLLSLLTFKIKYLINSAKTFFLLIFLPAVLPFLSATTHPGSDYFRISGRERWEECIYLFFFCFSLPDLIVYFYDTTET